MRGANTKKVHGDLKKLSLHGDSYSFHQSAGLLALRLEIKYRADSDGENRHDIR